MKIEQITTNSIILKLRTISFLGLAALFSVAQPVQAAETAKNSDDWQFTAGLYGWLPELKAETATGQDVDISLNDILDNLDFTFQGIVGAEKGKWGVLVDALYLDLSKDYNNPGGERLKLNQVDLRSWVVTPMATYNIIHNDKLILNLLGGARYLYLKPGLDVSPFGKRWTSGSVWDGIGGLRGQYIVNEKWYMPFHFDVGTGDTELTWQAFGAVGYKMGRYDIVAGYRYLKYEFDNSDKGGKVFNDLSIGGPIVGVSAAF